jgi:enamine deaminase RidA (YjgF/YER057c/UK114 family)
MGAEARLTELGIELPPGVAPVANYVSAVQTGAPGFNRIPQVIDGCSDVLVELFGQEIGRHARSAVGMAELPFNIPVEIEMIVEVGRE